MKDQEAINRREKVFDELQNSRIEFSKIEEESQNIRSKLYDKQFEMDQLKRLVDTMLRHDCCPLEAKLKYSEELGPKIEAGVLAASAEYGNTGKIR